MGVEIRIERKEKQLDDALGHFVLGYSCLMFKSGQSIKKGARRNELKKLAEQPAHEPIPSVGLHTASPVTPAGPTRSAVPEQPEKIAGVQ